MAIIIIDILIFAALIGGIIYLIFKRANDKKKETFEKRDW